MSNLSEAISNVLVDLWEINGDVLDIIIIGVTVVLWVVLGFLLIKISNFIIQRALKVSKKDPRSLTISRLVKSIIRYIVWFIVILLVLGELGVDITPFIATAGVLGLAIGFGTQELVKDFISGFFIIFEKTFNVDDVVEIDGFKGNVKSLGLRSTVIQNWKGEVKTINNGSIGSVVNFSKNDSVGIVDFGVSYDTNLENLVVLMNEFLDTAQEKYAVIKERPSFLGVTELADSSINVRIIFKTEPMQFFATERDLRKDVVTFLTEKNIEIPFPQLVLHNA